MSKSSTRTSLLILAFVTIVPLIWTYQKYLYNIGREPLTLTYQQLFWAFISIFLYLLYFKKERLVYLKGKSLSLTILASLFFGLLAFPIRAIGMQSTSAVNASILGRVQLIALIPLGYFFLKEKITLAKISLIIVSLIGFYMVAVDGSPYVMHQGDLFIIISAFTYAIGLIFTKRALESTHILSFALYRMLLTFIFSLIGIFLVAGFEFVFYSEAIMLGVFTTIPFLLQIKLFETLSVSSTSMLNISVTAFTIFLAVLLLNETLDMYQVVGGIIILLCTALIQKVDGTRAK